MIFGSLEKYARKLVSHSAFDRSIMVLIILNALILGAETFTGISELWLLLLKQADRSILIVFTVELLLRLVAMRASFFRDPWRLFDLTIVVISWVPSAGVFSVFRAMRILRAVRMFSVVPELRKVFVGLFRSLPGLGSVSVILLLVFYISAVMATNLFGRSFPDWFGTLGASAYTLFQVMTLESWSMGIVRPVMEVYGLAWLFFLPFIFITTFTMLNLFIGVMVNAMQMETEEVAHQRAIEGHEERDKILHELKGLRLQVDRLLLERSHLNPPQEAQSSEHLSRIDC